MLFMMQFFAICKHIFDLSNGIANWYEIPFFTDEIPFKRFEKWHNLGCFLHYNRVNFKATGMQIFVTMVLQQKWKISN